jgi:VWFA-related protein
MVLAATLSLLAQSAPQPEPQAAPSLRVNSRAVLLDVLVTDHKGVPVTGLAKEAFTVVEQGKAQTIGFFEEHRGASTAEPEKRTDEGKPGGQGSLPPNTFSNAFAPAVLESANAAVGNVLLLDTLNTKMADQIGVRNAAVAYLKQLKPGSRLAIYTLGMRLRYVQGFSDDPALLAAALGYARNGIPEAPSLLHESGSVAAFQSFIANTGAAEAADRVYRTMEGLKELATVLGRLPGRKNLIWLAGSFPLDPYAISGVPTGGGNSPDDTRFAAGIKDTFALLAAARVAVYPVDAQGVRAFELFTAESGAGGGGGIAARSALTAESIRRNSDYATMDLLAEKTGGKAFYSNNSLAGVIGKVVAGSGYFYTLSYTPSNANEDGTFRDIGVVVAGGKYDLSYRRGYFARLASPDAARTRKQIPAEDHNGPERDAGGFPEAERTDPLRPFMDLGLPQLREIGYQVVLQPVAGKDATDGEPAAKGAGTRYSVDFSIDRKGLKMALDAKGIYHSTLVFSMIVYDRYGQEANRDDRVISMEADEDKYAEFESEGVQVHQEIDLPKGEFWLRTGIYDRASHRIGTLEIPSVAIVAGK